MRSSTPCWRRDPWSRLRQLAKHRAALDKGADPTIVAGWISEVQGERLRTEREISLAQPSGHFTRQQIRELVTELGDIAGALSDADPKLKAQVYEELGISVTYDPTGRVARTESRPATPWATVSVGGGTLTMSTPAWNTSWAA
jgi:hypothetical protein